jgi:glycerol kinase
LKTLAWDEHLCREIGVPLGMLPRIVPSSSASDYGATAADGPLAGVPITAAVGDQQAALLGQCCFDPGDVKNTYGTGCFMLQNTGERPVKSSHGLLTTVAWQLGTNPAVYALEGSIAIAGALVQWLQENLGLFRRIDEVEAVAGGVADSGGVYIVPAFSGLFAPHWRPDARGVIVGLTRFVTRAHLARAALESTCYQTRDVLDAMRQDAAVPLSCLKVDGGMVANDLLMQIQADILGVQVVRPRMIETTAVGAAFAAGLAAGFWPDMATLRHHWQADCCWNPHWDEENRQAQYTGWRRAIERSLGLAP